MTEQADPRFDSLNPKDMRDGHNVKWHLYDEDVLPMWVADMDYPVATEILDGIHKRLNNRIGYPLNAGDPALLNAIIEQQHNFGLHGLEPKHLWLIASTVPGLYASVLGLTEPGDEIITQTPIYPPFLSSITDYGRIAKTNPMQHSSAGWLLDFAQLETLVTNKTKLLMLCNPHNPTGRVFTRQELEQLADFVLRHNLLVVTDELHADLIFEGTHIPFASLSTEIANRTVTLTGPCKTFNTAGLGGAVAITHNLELQSRMKAMTKGIMGHANSLTMAMWLAGLTQAQPWLKDARTYLKSNRDFLSQYVNQHFKNLKYSPPQATYLAWLDFRAYPFAPEAHKYFLTKARVGLNDGPPYGGQEQQGFLRLNFATSKDILKNALDAMRHAVEDK